MVARELAAGVGQALQAAILDLAADPALGERCSVPAQQSAALALAARVTLLRVIFHRLAGQRGLLSALQDRGIAGLSNLPCASELPLLSGVPPSGDGPVDAPCEALASRISEALQPLLSVFDASTAGERRTEIESLGACYEASLGWQVSTGQADGGLSLGGLGWLVPGGLRRSSGVHYSPRGMVTELLQQALQQPWPDGRQEGSRWPRLCDPALGGGGFLLQAARLLWAGEGGGQVGLERRRAVVEEQLFGVDRDALAVEVARMSLWLLVGDPDWHPHALRAHLRQGDALVGLDRASLRAWCACAAGAPGRTGALEDHSPGALVTACEESFEASRSGAARPCASTSLSDLLGRARVCADLLLEIELDASLSPRDRQRARASLHAQCVSALSDGAEGWSGLEERARRARAIHQGFHWDLEFPEPLFGARGFDLVVSNPPFGNAIEAQTRRGAGLGRLAKELFPVFARGAYDLSVLFWARACSSLLGVDGRYAWLSPSALLSSTQPWQAWMHEHWRPTHLTLYPVDAFSDARVRTCGYVGRRGAARSLLVCDRDVSGEPGSHERDWEQPWRPWYAITRGALHLAEGGSGLLRLEQVAELSAGCATGVAYQLRPHVLDASRAEGPRLVTTGAIDRYRCRWGERRIRYLGGDYSHPRWPVGDGPELVGGLRRARDRQACPKVLVGGLTAVLEAWHDREGNSAGVVSTWVLTSRVARGDPAELGLLTAMLNSATFCRRYMALHGASAMSGKQTTIKKRALAAMEVPEELARPRVALDREAALRWVREQNAALSGSQLAALLAAVSGWLGESEDDPGWSGLDALAHRVAAGLYGLKAPEAFDDYGWWCARSGTQPVAGELPGWLERTRIACELVTRLPN